MKQILAIMAIILLMSAPVLAQVDFCEGNFDNDFDVDGSDAFVFKTDFGKSSINNPCPPGVSCGGVLKTGQTGCWDTDGNPILCEGTGQDGEYQLGFSWFTDHGDFTVTDNSTGLMWTQDANLGGHMTWEEALDYVKAGRFEYTDWRLPNIRELKSIYDSVSFYDGIVPMEPHPFINVQSSSYWSSTTFVNFRNLAWVLNMSSGSVNGTNKVLTNYVWCVRGGQ